MFCHGGCQYSGHIDRWNVGTVKRAGAQGTNLNRITALIQILIYLKYMINVTNGDGAPLPQAFLYGDGGCVEFSWLLFNGPAVTGRIMNSELERISMPGFLLEI